MAFDWTQRTSQRERYFPEAVGMQDRALLGIFPVWGPGWLAEWSEALGLGSLEHPTPVCCKPGRQSAKIFITNIN